MSTKTPCLPITTCVVAVAQNKVSVSKSTIALCLIDLWLRLDDIRMVDVHTSRLRDKLLEDPGQPELILTVRGTGYAFQRIDRAENSCSP